MLFRTLGNRSIEAWTVRATEGYQVTVLGETFQIEVEDALRAGLKKIKASGNVDGEETIRAPMPGVVVEVKVQEGQSIGPGDPVVIVEAMKMRNEFGPKAGGMISKILVTKGQAVERGQPLALVMHGKADGAARGTTDGAGT
jgi:biotin carboxyl carrier protein